MSKRGDFSLHKNGSPVDYTFCSQLGIIFSNTSLICVDSSSWNIAWLDGIKVCIRGNMHISCLYLCGGQFWSNSHCCFCILTVIYSNIFREKFWLVVISDFSNDLSLNTSSPHCRMSLGIPVPSSYSPT